MTNSVVTATQKSVGWALATAFALSSTMPSPVSRRPVRNCYVAEAVSSTSTVDLCDFVSDSVSTAPKPLTHTEAAEIIAQALETSGFKATRMGRTSDKSVLFEFLGANRACIDFYPNGDLIVVIRKPQQDEIHELQYSDADLAIKLLNDAGVRS